MFIKTLEKFSRCMVEDFNTKILYEDIINKVLNTLPREYDELVDYLQVQMDTEIGVTLSNLKEQVIYKYQRINKN